MQQRDFFWILVLTENMSCNECWNLYTFSSLQRRRKDWCQSLEMTSLIRQKVKEQN